MGNYQRVAELEMERRAKGLPAKVDFTPVIYGKENRCPNCWTIMNEREDAVGNVSTYCFNCAYSQPK